MNNNPEIEKLMEECEKIVRQMMIADEHGYRPNLHSNSISEIRQLLALCRKQREALEFYAKKKHIKIDVDDRSGYETRQIADDGAVAREVLNIKLEDLK